MTGPSQEPAASEGLSRDDDDDDEPGVVPESNIVPVRVDVVSQDKTLRIVDTLLLDPTCWPVPLYQPMFDAVEENISLMAHTILSDAEVQGMGRTVRHFTGRLDLWTAKLQEAVEDQLRPQLWKIATMHHREDAPHHHKDETRVPISIRLMVDRIVVHEDLLWDMHGALTPFEFAQDMASELNLPDEATVAIATTILEQIHGLPIDGTPDPTLTNNNNNSNGNSNGNTTSKPSPRGAWMIDPKEQAAIASQVVAQHRSL